MRGGLVVILVLAVSACGTSTVHGAATTTQPALDTTPATTPYEPTTLLPPPSVGPDYAGLGRTDFCEDKPNLLSILTAYDRGQLSDADTATHLNSMDIAIGAAHSSLVLGEAPKPVSDEVSHLETAIQEFSDILTGGRSDIPAAGYEAQLKDELASVEIAC